jgi:hypothetical protein
VQNRLSCPPGAVGRVPVQGAYARGRAESTGFRAVPAIGGSGNHSGGEAKKNMVFSLTYLAGACILCYERGW